MPSRFIHRLSVPFALLLCVALLVALSAPPPTPREVVVEEMHGVRIEDPYRWLEGGILESDPAKARELDRRVNEWTDAQNDFTRSVLDNLPGRADIESRIRELMTVDSIGAAAMYGNRYFNRERRGDENQSVLYVREGPYGEPRVLLDPNELDERGLISLDWHAPNHDGSLMAFGLSYAGEEKPTLYVMNVETGTWLADEIPNRVSGVNWLPDSSGFLYRVLRDRDDPYSAQIKFHVLGTHHRQAPILFEQFDQTWGPGAWLSRDGRWMMLMYWTGTKSNDLWVIDFDRWQRTGDFDRVEIAVGKDARFWGPVYGDTLYLRTTLDAPNGIVYAVDLNNPAQENWRVVIPQRDDAVLTSLDTARGMLIATYGYKAHTLMERFDLAGNSLGEIELPGVGSASIATADDRTEVFISYTSFNEPPSIYYADLKRPGMELWARPEIPVDPSLVEVKQVTYESKDGTAITMFLVHRADITLDGNNPTLLTGYGGFNISMTPRFSSTMFPWYEAGGVMALPNLRGGGEYGDAWHRDGILENKQNVFDDFIAAAEWLVDQGYTTPERLAISGGSNGGLLVGAVATQRPELFRAVVCSVPLLDMLRYQHFLMARFWVPEYGDPADADQFRHLYAYSPYHHIRESVTYPAMLITAGENDARVHPLHARKMAAALQHVNHDPQDRPIIIWSDREAGHGAGKPLSARIRDIADVRIFIMWQLGMLDEG